MNDIDPAVARQILCDRDLLAEFGLVLHGAGPGVTASLADRPLVRGRGCFGEAVSFDHIEWTWLRPLLEELRTLRKGPVA